MRGLAFLLAASLLGAQAPAFRPGTLAWLQGRWVGEAGEERYEEFWSFQGQSLLGVSRTLKEGRSSFTELFTLEPEGDQWVLRLRMFGEGITQALKGRDEPLRLRLAEADARHVRYEGLGPEAGTTVSYWLEGDTLHAAVDKVKNGKPWREAYAFHRAP